MPRLIDADALRDRMYHDAFETDSDMQKWDSGCWIRYKMFENALEEAPTVDAVKVVRCKDCKHFSFWCELHETRVDPEEDYCSWAEGYKRCPFCGAKMDEVEDAD